MDLWVVCVLLQKAGQRNGSPVALVEVGLVVSTAHGAVGKPSSPLGRPGWTLHK